MKIYLINVSDLTDSMLPVMEILLLVGGNGLMHYSLVHSKLTAVTRES